MTVLKKIFFLLVFLSATNLLVAQISLGVRGGITLPNVTLNEDPDDPYYYYGEIDYLVFMGGAIGAVCEIKLHKNFAIQPELMLVQKGTKVNLPEYYYYYYYPGFNDETKLRINYLEIPILAKGLVGNGSVVGYAAVGPTLGFAATGYTTQQGEKTTLKDQDWDLVKRFELGASLGAGVGLTVGNGQAFLDLRYLLGLTEVFKDSDINAKNRTPSITVGYMVNM